MYVCIYVYIYEENEIFKWCILYIKAGAAEYTDSISAEG